MDLPDFSLPITDPVLIFALVMLLILVLPLGFQRLRVPGLVGLILAGVLIGPHALGLLARDQTMTLLGTVGILYIMFIAGLEVDLNEFNRHRNRSITLGLSTFALPQGLGTLVGRYVLGFDWIAAVLLGAVFASHTLLAYPIISRLGLAKRESVTTSVGATILTDTAALLVLAVIVRIYRGAFTPAFFLVMLAVLGGYMAAVLWGVPWLGRWFFRKIRSDGVAEFVFVLAVVFVCAYLATLAGVEAIIGAFLAGLALNRLVPEHSTLMNRTRFVGDALFIPFFLLSVGMLVDPRVFFEGAETWLVALAMIFTVTLTKWSAAALTRPFFGYTWDEAWMVFGLTVPQAAATLATVLIGFNVGIFGPGVLNGTILMILVTCMLGPWVAERFGRRVAVQAEQAPYEPSRAPQRLLVPLANPETAPLLMDLALMVRQSTSTQPIYPLAVVQEEEDVQARVAIGEKLLSHAVVHAAAANVPVVPLIRIDHNVASGILRAVREQIISTILLGWNGQRPARHSIFGSILDQTLHESRELVLVSKIEQPLSTVERIVLAAPPYADLDPGSADAVRVAKVLAQQMGARMLVLATAERTEALRALFQRTKPDVPVIFQPLPAWPHLLDAIEREHQPDDLLMLLAAREGTLAWQPALDRLPRLLTRRFPDASLVVCYPPLPYRESAPTRLRPPSQSPLLRLLTPERVALSVTGNNPETVLRWMLRALPEDQCANAIAALSGTGADYLPELRPGVMLYHAHLSRLPAPMLFVGITTDGLDLLPQVPPVHVVLILLSPEEDAPERHLRHLALVARLVHSDEAVGRLRQAGTVEEVMAVMSQTLS